MTGNIKKKAFSLMVFFLFFSLYSIFIIVSCSVLRLDSDKANHLLQAKDIAKGNFFLNDWILTGVSFLTTDLVYYVIGYLIGGVSLRSIYVSTGLMVSVALTVGYLSSIVGRKVRLENRLLYLFVIGIPSVGLLYHFRVHTGALTFILLCFVLLNEIIEKRISAKFNLLICFLMIIGVFGDLLVAIECCLPITVYAVYQLAINVKDNRKKYYSYVWSPSASVVLGLIAQKIYIKIGGADLNSYITSKRNFTSVTLWPDKFHRFIKDLLYISGADFTGHPIDDFTYSVRIFSFILLLLSVIVAFTLIIKVIKKEKIDNLSFLILLSIVFSAAAYIFSDMSEARYITIIPLGLAIVFVRNVGSIFDYFVNKRLISLVLLFVVLIQSISNCSNIIINNVSSYYSIQNYSQLSLKPNYDVIDFLEAHNLKCGYASFWNASVFTVLSEENVRIRHVSNVDGRFEMKKWFCKYSWYEEEANFILINTNGEGDGVFGNNADIATRFFGKPIEQYSISGYIVLVYDYDLSKQLGKEYNPLFDGVVDSIEMSSFGSNTLKDQIVIHSAGAVYGPYASIEAGTYEIVFEGARLDNAVIDIHSESCGDDMFDYQLISCSDNSYVFELNVYSTINDIEFRVFNNSCSDVIINRICVQ